MKVKSIFLLFFCFINTQIVVGQSSDEIYQRHKKIFFQKMFACYEMSHKVINETNVNTRFLYIQVTGSFLDDATLSLNKMQILGEEKDLELEKLIKVVQMFEVVVKRANALERPEDVISLEFAKSKLWKVSTEVMCNHN